jgi:hypothetical protein
MCSLGMFCTGIHGSEVGTPLLFLQTDLLLCGCCWTSRGSSVFQRCLELRVLGYEGFSQIGLDIVKIK